MKMYIAVAIALLLAGGALATGASQNTNYVVNGAVSVGATNSPSLTIWCKDGGHNYAPIGNPEDYADTSDPVNNPDGFVNGHESWAVSGEPECLAGDVAFGEDDDSGIGGAAYCVGGFINGVDCGDHRGHDLQSSTNDVIGTPWHTVTFETCGEDQPDCTTSDNTGENVVGGGCGTASVQIPMNLARHWQSPISAPTFLGWDRIKTAYVDETTGNVCLGASGTVTAEF